MCKVEDLVDPELRPFLAAIPVVDFTTKSIMEIREGLDLGAFAIAPRDDLPVAVEVMTIPGPPDNAAIRVFTYRPRGAAAPLPAILHIHAGGYVLGSPILMDAYNREISAHLGCAIFSVSYRLAPETAFPGAVEDCYAALSWLVANARSLGVDPARIGVKGESAGGGLAAALALLARDRGEYKLAFQNLMAPMLDDRTCLRADVSPYVGALAWTPEQNSFGWASLLGSAPGGADVSHYAAPARAASLAGLPPTFISVGALDLFLEENLDYARRLAIAGAPIELHVYPGAFHGFDMMPTPAVSISARQASEDALRRGFGT